MSDWVETKKRQDEKKLNKTLREIEKSKDKSDQEVQLQEIAARKHEKKIREIKRFIKKRYSEFDAILGSRSKQIKIAHDSPNFLGICFHSMILVRVLKSGLFRVYLYNANILREKEFYIPVFLLTEKRVDRWLKWMVESSEKRTLMPFSPIQQGIWFLILIMALLSYFSLLQFSISSLPLGIFMLLWHGIENDRGGDSDSMLRIYSEYFKEK